MSHEHAHAHDDGAPSPHTREFWDERYGGADRVWSGNPNRRLVEQVGDLVPDPGARALDVGCGEGADVVWLARQGWVATGADVSEVGLTKTRQHAAEAGVEVDTVRWDAAGDQPLPGGPYDLVVSHFLHLPVALRHAAYARMAEAVAPGGRLLVVGHHPDDVHSGARRPHGDGLLFDAAEITGLFAERTAAGVAGESWEVEVAEEPTREQDTPDGPMTVRDTVVRLRRV